MHRRQLGVLGVSLADDDHGGVAVGAGAAGVADRAEAPPGHVEDARILGVNQRHLGVHAEPGVGDAARQHEQQADVRDDEPGLVLLPRPLLGGGAEDVGRQEEQQADEPPRLVDQLLRDLGVVPVLHQGAEHYV